MKTILSIDPSGNPAGHTGVVLIGYDDTVPAYALASWAVQGGVEPFRDWINIHVNYLWGDDDGEGYPKDAESIFVSWYDLYPNSLTSRYNKVYPEVVICEKFVPRNIPGADYTPLVMEGVVQWIWPDVVFDSASGYKTAVPDEILKRLGLWFTGDHHGDRNSAARHAVRYLKDKRHIPTLKTGWSPNAR